MPINLVFEPLRTCLLHTPMRLRFRLQVQTEKLKSKNLQVWVLGLPGVADFNSHFHQLAIVCVSDVNPLK